MGFPSGINMGAKKNFMCKVNNKDYANERLKIMRIFNKRELLTRL